MGLARRPGAARVLRKEPQESCGVRIQPPLTVLRWEGLQTFEVPRGIWWPGILRPGCQLGVLTPWNPGEKVTCKVGRPWGKRTSPGNSLLFLVACPMNMIQFVQDLRQVILITCASMPSPVIGR